MSRSFYTGKVVVLNNPEWITYPPGTAAYRLKVHVVPDGGGFHVYASELPGCASQGDTVPEALDNIKEAVEGVLAAYRDEGMQVPWAAEKPLPRGGYRCTVYVVLGEGEKP